MIHFYKRFQIKLLLPGPRVGLIEFVEETSLAAASAAEEVVLSQGEDRTPLVDNRGVREDEWGW